MTCRSLLWIATAASIAAATSQPSVAVAEPSPSWSITIDEPTAAEVIESKHLTIEGTVSNGAGVDGVTVTVVPQDLPPQCGAETGRATMAGEGYVIGLDVECNGPYRIEVVANGPSGSATGEPRAVGVAERPPTPLPPDLTVTDEGGLRASWDPGQDIDSAGTILLVDFREETIDRGIGEAILPPADRLAAVSMRALRWGAAGPGTTVSSPESGGAYIGPDPPPEPPDESTDPTQPPPSEPLTPRPPPSVGPNGDSSPSPNTGGRVTPTPASTPSTTSLPPQPSDPHPSGALSEPIRRPSSDAEERAISTAPPDGGLVRTRDERSPGLVSLLALALLIIAVAAVVVRHTRRRAEPVTTRWEHRHASG